MTILNDLMIMKFFFLLFVIIFSGCASRKSTLATKVMELRFLGSYTISLNQQYKGTTIGGLSGIDYDAGNDCYYIISDDGSKISPARFYTASIQLSGSGIDTVKFENVTLLSGPDGAPYRNSATDPESIRYHPGEKLFYWCSEGERIRTNETLILRQPSVNVSGGDGKWLDSFLMPANHLVYPGERGSRNNSSFEGLTFDEGYEKLFVHVEEPLFEDGHRAAGGDTSAVTRIIVFDVKSRKAMAQYAYLIDPVAYPASPGGAFRINGVSEILWIAKDQLLVVERSFSTGRLGCVIRIYLADLSGATDISQVVSPGKEQMLKPVPKKLLLNTETLGIPVYNMEGVTLGPRLPNGRRTLIFVADDNFSSNDKTQFLLFEVASF